MRDTQKESEITLRTTMLVGFPGETEEDFEDLLDFVRKMRFNRLGVFTYSHEEGTSGYELEDDVPDDVKQGVPQNLCLCRKRSLQNGTRHL